MNGPAIDKAVDSAVLWIQRQRHPEGHWESRSDPNDRYWAGDTGLAVLSLLYAGLDPRTDDLNRALEWLAAQRLNATYTYAVRAHALALVSGGKFRKRLEDDTEWLRSAIVPRAHENFGLYGYVSAKEDSGWVDHSNSQFGVLGMWMASEAGLGGEDDEGYWLLVEDRWMSSQNADGGWGYMPRQESTGSMTAAGLATLYVVLDRVHARTGHRRAQRLVRAIDGALAWFGREFTPDNPRGEARWKHYYLYGVERAGRASGRKYFRGRDWFREGAADLLRTQDAQGSWSGGAMTPLQNTAFALMFLCHGRAPLLFNKLEQGDDWDAHLRDASGLARYCSHAFERLLNWQIVDLRAPLADLMEAPVLFMSGTSAWAFDEAQVLKLREYCLRGGMIFACPADGSGAFELGVRALAERLFPDLPLRPMPVDHPLFDGRVQTAIENPPLMFHVTNGVRSLLIFSPEDLGQAWNEYRVRARPRDFHVGANVYLLATDKTAPRTRFETPEIAVREVAVSRTIRVARLRYAGAWDAEPYGWVRLRNYMNNETRTRLLVSSGVPLDSAELLDFRVAHITGSAAFELTPAELAGLRSFLTNGGTLLADGAGGSRAFVASLESHVRAAIGVEPQTVPRDSILVSGAGLPDAVSLRGVGYRRTTRVGDGRDWPHLRAFDLGRRLAVIYSPFDLSAGLLGTSVFGCDGYAPESCLRIMRNLLLYADLTTAEKAERSRGR